MAGHVRFTALLDANVLYPLAVCDALIEVAVTGIYAAKWTTRIDNEWIRNLAINRGIAPERLWVRRDAMHVGGSRRRLALHRTGSDTA
jgi:hypothetical protein